MVNPFAFNIITDMLRCMFYHFIFVFNLILLFVLGSVFLLWCVCRGSFKLFLHFISFSLLKFLYMLTAWLAITMYIHGSSKLVLPLHIKCRTFVQVGLYSLILLVIVVVLYDSLLWLMCRCSPKGSCTHSWGFFGAGWI